MKKIINFVCMAAILMMAACSSDEPIINNQGSVSPDKNTTAILKTVVTDWGASPETVATAMKGYTRQTLSSEEEIFHSSDGLSSVIYQYFDGGLTAAVVALPRQSDNLSLEGVLGLSLMGERYGSKIYKQSASTFATLFQATDNTTSTLVGFASVKGGDFPEVATIEVTTDEATAIGVETARLNATVTGGGSVSRCVFEYSTDPTLANYQTISASAGSTGHYSAQIKSLSINSTYYYRVKATVDNINYYGQICSFETQKAVTYSVGDPYPDAYATQGIVCEVDAQGLHGTIISTSHDYLKWDVNGIFCNDYGYNKSDGTKNSLPSNQPFGAWIKALGTGWYGPALYELTALSKVVAAVNSGLRRIGAEPLDGFYWASTQYSNNHAYFVCVSETGYMGYNNGYYTWVNKDNSHQCIGMKKF